ncbi:hypothetical protein QR680_006575 [Steinernema hermaphroditum]|uniref:Uncharacterized protein n=1 Tax=Steinernema hermaphroditum TaxID=289476 RepID=A0AA39LXM6_9BILA|nr:hypothetical protein QR680_006575 [Steinernema hermaphroditum]
MKAPVLILLFSHGVLLEAHKWIHKITAKTPFDDYIIGNLTYIGIEFSLDPGVLGLICICFFAEHEEKLEDKHGCHTLPGFCVGRALARTIEGGTIEYEFAGSSSDIEVDSKDDTTKKRSDFDVFRNDTRSLPFLARFPVANKEFSHKLKINIKTGQLLAVLSHLDLKNIKIRDVDRIRYRGSSAKRTIALMTVCKLTDCSKGWIRTTNLEAFPKGMDMNTVDGIDKSYLPQAVDVLYNIAMGVFIFVVGITVVAMLLQCYLLLFYNR